MNRLMKIVRHALAHGSQVGGNIFTISEASAARRALAKEGITADTFTGARGATRTVIESRSYVCVEFEGAGNEAVCYVGQMIDTTVGGLPGKKLRCLGVVKDYMKEVQHA